MTPQTKKVVVITISLLSLAGLSYFAYTYFKKKKEEDVLPTPSDTIPTTTPPVITTETGVRTAPTPRPNDAPSFDQKKADYTSGGRLKTIDDPLSIDEAKYYTRVFQEWHDGQEFPKEIRLGRDGIAGNNTKKQYKKYGKLFRNYLDSFNNSSNRNAFPRIRIARIDKYLNA